MHLLEKWKSTALQGNGPHILLTDGRLDSTVTTNVPSVNTQVLYCALLYCTVLCCTVLCCTVLYCTVLYCAVLYCAVLYCTVLYCTVLCCSVLYCAVLYCTVLYCTVLYCTLLYSPTVCRLRTHHRHRSEFDCSRPTDEGRSAQHPRKTPRDRKSYV